MDTLLDILREYDIPYKTVGQHRHATSKYIQIDCPFCSPNTSRFRMGLSSSHAVCWRCGYHRLGDTLSTVLEIHVSLVMGILNRINNSLDASFSKSYHTNKSVKFPSGFKELGIPHKKYLQKRGFDPNKLEKFWKLKAYYHQGLPWRILIPIHYQGEVVSWTSRSIGKFGVKYLSANSNQEKINHKNLLFGEDHCLHVVIICEGPFDVFKVGPGAVALFGLGWSQEQLQKLSQFPVRVICFDNEIKAQNKAERLKNYLGNLEGETYSVKLESGNDPGDADPEEIEKLRNQFLE